MEIDLLSEAHRIAIEIDGPQHLTPEHYRRDRRKDALFQTNGYVILRFLAEDLGKHLDAVLDTVLRVVAGRK
jgi:very-short-patch-repair endonuclease